MSNRTIRTKRGDTVGVFIKGQTGEDQIRAVGPAPASKKFVGGDIDEDSYVFRKKGVFQIFDLGTRLRTQASDYEFTGLEMRNLDATDKPVIGDGFVNEYVELRYEVEGSSLIGLEPADFGVNYIQVSDVEFAQLERLLLGSRAPDAVDPLDPLGFTIINTNGEGKRKAPHCMPLYYGQIASLAQNQFPIRINTIPLSTLITDGRATLRGSGDDSDERWYEDNRFSGAAWNWLIFDKDYLNELKGGHIAIDDGFGFYYPLDTSQPETKVTTRLDFNADEVTYKFNIQDRFYLRPQLGGLARVNVILGVVRCVASWVSRSYNLGGKQQIIPVLVNTFPSPARNWVRRSQYSHYDDIPGATVTGSTPFFAVQSDPTIVNNIPHGALIGIIAGPKKVYYLWRRWYF
jgi:hypothetical protein